MLKNKLILRNIRNVYVFLIYLYKKRSINSFKNELIDLFNFEIKLQA